MTWWVRWLLHITEIMTNAETVQCWFLLNLKVASLSCIKHTIEKNSVQTGKLGIGKPWSLINVPQSLIKMPQGKSPRFSSPSFRFCAWYKMKNSEGENLGKYSPSFRDFRELWVFYLTLMFCRPPYHWERHNTRFATFLVKIALSSSLSLVFISVFHEQWLVKL